MTGILIARVCEISDKILDESICWKHSKSWQKIKLFLPFSNFCDIGISRPFNYCQNTILLQILRKTIIRLMQMQQGQVIPVSSLSNIAKFLHVTLGCRLYGFKNIGTKLFILSTPSRISFI